MMGKDLIDRREAIDALFGLYEYQRDIDPTEAADLVRQGIYLAEKKIEQLPPAQPERKRGKWIAVTEDGDVYKRICSCCGREAFFQNDDPDELYDGGRYELSDFCPHCGADMRKDEQE